MYKVYCDGSTLHDPSLNDTTYQLIDPVVTQEMNLASKFTFTMLANHKQYNSINRLASVIETYDDNKLIFRGRVTNDTRGWENSRQITCEGDLAMLNDTRVRPYNYTGSVSGLFTQLITQHNNQVPASKRFTVGTVTVTSSGNITRSSTVYPTTWKEIKEKLLDELGGYLFLVRNGSTNRLDYLADSPYTCTQQITFGENLLDFSQTEKGEDIITALIPLGQKNEDTDRRLTIASVNGGLDYITDATAAAAYGLIIGTEEWDSITNASTLLARGQERLQQLTSRVSTIQLTALDLHLLDADISSFDCGAYVTVKDTKHGVDGSMLISKKSTHLTDPAQGKITIGKEGEGISEYHASTANQAEMIHQNYVTNEYVKDIQTSLQTNINQQSDKIALVVEERSGGYVIKAAEIVESINETGSTVKISADHIELNGTVVVNAINNGSTTINGSKITTGTMNADRIGAGTIDASVVTITNLNASNITAGSLQVIDGNNNVLFAANKTAKTVAIAGFTVAKDKMTFEKTASGVTTKGSISNSQIRFDNSDTADYSIMNASGIKVTDAAGAYPRAMIDKGGIEFDVASNKYVLMRSANDVPEIIIQNAAKHMHATAEIINVSSASATTSMSDRSIGITEGYYGADLYKEGLFCNYNGNYEYELILQGGNISSGDWLTMDYISTAQESYHVKVRPGAAEFSDPSGNLSLTTTSITLGDLTLSSAGMTIASGAQTKHVTFTNTTVSQATFLGTAVSGVTVNDFSCRTWGNVVQLYIRFTLASAISSSSSSTIFNINSNYTPSGTVYCDLHNNATPYNMTTTGAAWVYNSGSVINAIGLAAGSYRMSVTYLRV